METSSVLYAGVERTKNMKERDRLPWNRRRRRRRRRARHEERTRRNLRLEWCRCLPRYPLPYPSLQAALVRSEIKANHRVVRASRRETRRAAKEQQTRAIYRHILRHGAGEGSGNLRPGFRERELRFLMLLAETFAPRLGASLEERERS